MHSLRWTWRLKQPLTLQMHSRPMFQTRQPHNLILLAKLVLVRMLPLSNLGNPADRPD